jgi:hypothetical protein
MIIRHPQEELPNLATGWTEEWEKNQNSALFWQGMQIRHLVSSQHGH